MIDTPISELGLAGAAVGAALTGMRPVLEIQFSDFVTLAMEQIVNQAAKIRFMFGGKASVPMVVRLPGGSGTGAAGQHSQSLEAWFAHVPGLKVVQPSTPHDAKGLLLAAIDDPNPVLIFEHKLLYKTKGAVPAAPYRVPIGEAVVRREGRDVTDRRRVDHDAARAARPRSDSPQEGIDAEVIDLRSLRPIDFRDDRAQACARRGRLRHRVRRREDDGHRRRNRGDDRGEATCSTRSRRRSCVSVAPTRRFPTTRSSKRRRCRRKTTSLRGRAAGSSAEATR